MLARTAVYAAFAAAALLIPPSSVFAQELGAKAGVNFASLTPEEDESPDVSRRRGFVGGAWVRPAASGRFSLQIEGLFSEKGVKADTDAFGGDASADLRLRYLEIPVLARTDFGASSSTARVFAVAGAAPAFKLSGRVKARFEGDEDTRDVSDEIKPFDLGLVGGVGVAVGRALVEARYTHGLLHINEDDNGDEDRIKNRVLSVTVGFRFR